jgi:phospholipid/cholesterol/gamma-HCH transport system ATP-binding protein
MEPDTQLPKIQIKGVTKAFGAKKVLQGIDLDIQKGESVVIIGGSGTGKSVTLKCILGLLTPDAGSIKIDGQEVTGMSMTERDKINRQVGMLFQGGALFDSLPVWENVAFGLLSRKQCDRDEARNIAVKKLALVGLKPALAEAWPADLSIGMQKRVGLARAIATDPEIIFFDEPTTGLDPIMADMINELIVHVNQEVGATAMSISHDMESARKIGDRIAMLYQGKIVWAGDPDAIDGETNPVVDQFVHGRVDGPIKMQVRA